MAILFGNTLQKNDVEFDTIKRGEHRCALGYSKIFFGIHVLIDLMLHKPLKRRFDNSLFVSIQLREWFLLVWDSLSNIII